MCVCCLNCSCSSLWITVSSQEYQALAMHVENRRIWSPVGVQQQSTEVLLTQQCAMMIPDRPVLHFSSIPHFSTPWNRKTSMTSQITVPPPNAAIRPLN